MNNQNAHDQNTIGYHKLPLKELSGLEIAELSKELAETFNIEHPRKVKEFEDSLEKLEDERQELTIKDNPEQLRAIHNNLERTEHILSLFIDYMETVAFVFDQYKLMLFSLYNSLTEIKSLKKDLEIVINTV